MFYFNSKSTDPYLNLAIEEVLLKNDRRDFLLLYINTPSVIIGKHQTAHKEADTRFTFENNIPVIRRISGGGTVYHDKGNVNFSFITESKYGQQVDFKKYTAPVINFLRSMGIDARFEGKNDIRVNGLKISGNAEHVHRERVLHHGTLLFETSLNGLGNSIRKDTSCYASRSVDSNPSRVTNLHEMLPDIQNIDDFRERMIDYMVRAVTGMRSYEPDEIHLVNAKKLALEKYQTWEWNYAYGPEYHFRNRFRFNGEDHVCHFRIKDGIIVESRIEGSPALTGVAERLKGCRHMPADISETIAKERSELCNLDIFSFF